MPYVAALGLTLAIELPAYGGVLRGVLDIPARRAVLAAAAVNLISHPLAFLVVMPRIARSLGYFPALAVVEMGVVLVESVLLLIWLRRDPDLVALAALLVNALSLGIGLALIV
jgi:hypothetical protein